MDNNIWQLILWIVTGIIGIIIYIIWDKLKLTVSEKYCNKCSNGHHESIVQILDRFNAFEVKIENSINELRTLFIKYIGGK